MTAAFTKKRLDEILLAEELVNEAQIREALEYQKEHGGKLGSHLLRLHYIDEKALLGALAKQFGCKSVRLSDLDIHQLVIRFIPAAVARARRVVPFDYDPERNTLKVACEDPTDLNLINEIRFVARGKNIELYIAPEIEIRSAVARYYFVPEDDVSGDNDTRAAVSPIDGESKGVGEPQGEAEASVSSQTIEPSGSALLLTDDLWSDSSLHAMLEASGYRVTVIDSAKAGIALLEDQIFNAVFIRDSISGDYLDLIDRVRKISVSTHVRYYNSVSEILIDQTESRPESELVLKNLSLLTAFMEERDPQAAAHSARVGGYVDRMCKRLGLPERDRLAIVTAAHLHDLARLNYRLSDDHEQDDQSAIIRDQNDATNRTARLLDSMAYPPLVIGVLESMYLDLSGKYTKRLPVEALGGNLVTAADLFCAIMPKSGRISIDRFDSIKRRFEEQTGKLFLSEVTEAFLEMIREEMLAIENVGPFSQVMVLGAGAETNEQVALFLEEARYRTVVQESVERAVDLYKRSHPDFLVLVHQGAPEEITPLVERLRELGLDYATCPTFLLAAPEVIGKLSKLLEEGLEDILPLGGSQEHLLIKMNRIRTRLELERGKLVRFEQGPVASGSLEKMSFSDLLNALCSNNRTARLILSRDNESLTACITGGKISFAECGNLVGAGAVYHGFTWTSGEWRIEEITPEDIPSVNCSETTGTILTEGARLTQQTRVPERS